MINLLEEEKIILKKRRHWFILVLEVSPLVIAAFVPPIITAASASLPWVGEIFANFTGIAVFSLFAWWLFLWMILFVVWTNYYLDVIVITNKRIIDIEQLGLFARDVVEVRMENIEDIKTEVLGLIASLLDMGNIHIQTAAESREIIIKNIAGPHSLREVISKCRDEAGNMV